MGSGSTYLETVYECMPEDRKSNKRAQFCVTSFMNIWSKIHKAYLVRGAIAIFLEGPAVEGSKPGFVGDHSTVILNANHFVQF